MVSAFTETPEAQLWAKVLGPEIVSRYFFCKDDYT
jgi:hypothetical protein